MEADQFNLSENKIIENTFAITAKQEKKGRKKRMEWAWK